jgi:hypothetical protein
MAAIVVRFFVALIFFGLSPIAFAVSWFAGVEVVSGISSGSILVAVRRSRQGSEYAWSHVIEWASHPVAYVLNIMGYAAMCGLGFLAGLLLLFSCWVILRGSGLSKTQRDLLNAIRPAIVALGAVWLLLFFGLRGLYAAGVLRVT